MTRPRTRWSASVPGEAYRLGDVVSVKLVEAVPMAGALRFEMLSRGKRGHVAAMPQGIAARGASRAAGIRGDEGFN